MVTLENMPDPRLRKFGHLTFYPNGATPLRERADATPLGNAVKHFRADPRISGDANS
jgi:hypothetical protein